jgi:DNA polymerase-1
MTKDKNLMDGFKQGLDIHIHTASKILSIPIEKVGKKERSIGKTINYAVIYGMSAYHLSQRMDISMNEAQAFIDTYYKEYSGVKKFKEELIEEAEKKGYVETYFGRRRYIPELLSRDKNIQNSGIRIAVNAPVQGTASEIVKLAMIKIEGKQFPIDMLLQIHDELIFEGETELLEKYSSRIAEIMETIVNFGVDLKVDYNIGKNWLDIH